MKKKKENKKIKKLINHQNLSFKVSVGNSLKLIILHLCMYSITKPFQTKIAFYLQKLLTLEF